MEETYCITLMNRESLLNVTTTYMSFYVTDLTPCLSQPERSCSWWIWQRVTCARSPRPDITMRWSTRVEQPSVIQQDEGVGLMTVTTLWLQYHYSSCQWQQTSPEWWTRETRQQWCNFFFFLVQLGHKQVSHSFNLIIGWWIRKAPAHVRSGKVWRHRNQLWLYLKRSKPLTRDGNRTRRSTVI